MGVVYFLRLRIDYGPLFTVSSPHMVLVSVGVLSAPLLTSTTKPTTLDSFFVGS